MSMNGQAVVDRAPTADLSALEAQIQQLQAQVDALRAQAPDNRLSDGGLFGRPGSRAGGVRDCVGCGCQRDGGLDVLHLLGLTALRQKRESRGKTLFQKLMGWMTPVGLRGLGVSKMNFGGVGAKMLRTIMRQHGVPQPEEMAQMARDLGVRIVACQMSMDVMGIHKEELIDGVEVGGVATFLGDATRSKATLFI
jgi:peroxiredoxin family protein